ncbi:unnamed protein product [Eruca vesicaria subsp. sativa]|uniref:No apical meristem-associated C-terminal domain-containing protein n=1 Tax=Eruca vesicaria subsp. sativa TaxID=29727 RepID=A0ABC8M831_ERUVS|nr:unnamed protein product [Eruca vesicaria subsp. sativa]
MKDIPKFSDNVNIGILDIESDTVGSPASQSPGFSSSTINLKINLNSDDGGSNLSQRSIGSKKAKLKRKLDEGNTSVDNLVSSNEQILNFLKESASSREKNNEMVLLRMQNQAKTLALKEMEE